MAGRRPTAAQVRDRRSKRMAIGLGLLLIVVGVIQGPKLLKQLSPPAPPAPTPVAAVGATGATGATAASVGSTGPAGTQLQSFSLLSNKDPFFAQVGATEAAGAAGSAASASTKTKTTGATSKAPKTATGAKTGTTATTPSAAAAPAAPAVGSTAPVGFTVAPPNAALLTTNGHRQVVSVGKGFPSPQPLFKLVALGKKGSIRIGVLGGSFASGAPTLLLLKGQKITLANQSDGSRYVVQLIRQTTAAATTQSGGTTATTPTATTPVATTPVTTTPVTTTPAATTSTTSTTTTTTATPAG